MSANKLDQLILQMENYLEGNERDMTAPPSMRRK